MHDRLENACTTYSAMCAFRRSIQSNQIDGQVTVPSTMANAATDVVTLLSMLAMAGIRAGTEKKVTYS